MKPSRKVRRVRMKPSRKHDLHLPPEIWTEILLRLPVKSILRCRPVCKSWYSLISCPNFIQMYSSRNLHKTSNRLLLNFNDLATSKGTLISYDESFVESTDHAHHDLPEPFPYGYLIMVGSCNGLICLCRMSDSDFTFLIWNPSIRKIIELPPVSFESCITHEYGSFFGFGFDSNTGDYKVLCVVCDRVDRVGGYHDMVPIASEICDLSKGVWRHVSSVAPLFNGHPSGPDCSLNGVVHWSGCRQVKSADMDRVVMTFNMSDEVFGEIMMPSCAEFTEIWSYCRSMVSKTVACGGLLHVIVWDSTLDEFYGMPGSCSVWAMKEYGVTDSWTKLSNIHLPSLQALPTSILLPDSFHLWEDGEDIMVINVDISQNCYGVLYNIRSRKSKRLFSINKSMPGMCFYKESLVLL